MESDNHFSHWIPWMRRALHLAALGDGFTSPNPLVGSVVLDVDGNLIGEGFHRFAGANHAEVEALSQAGDRAKGGSIVVTLEPCCHQGKTPPCTDAILNSGVRKVVIGMKDPDPRVSGKGISILKEAGLDVLTDVLEDEVAYQNRAFVFRVITGRPWGVLKWAMSLDGRIGLPNGESKWISGEQARMSVYRLRSKCDAVIVGGGTVRADNPLLTSRGISNPEPLRVVVTKSLDLPKQSQLWDTSIAKTLIVNGSESNKKLESQIPKGPELFHIPNLRPKELLEFIAQKGCNKVLWECGPSLATQAIQQNCIQELCVVIAPKILGGVSSMNPIGDLGFTSMNQVLLFDNLSIDKLGNDLVFKTILNRPC